MNGPKCESDNRGGIKFCEEGGARLEFDGIAWITKIPHGKKFFNSLSCRLSLSKSFPQVASVKRNLPIRFSADKNHSGALTILRGGAHETVWVILNYNHKAIFFLTNQAGGKYNEKYNCYRPVGIAADFFTSGHRGRAGPDSSNIC
jgi:hypothetical protein